MMQRFTNEDISTGYLPSEVSYGGYTTSNLHRSKDAIAAFLNTIERMKKGLVDDRGGYLLKALKATDAYMKLNDLHLQQEQAPNAEEVKAWATNHAAACQALKQLNEFLHHYDYWNAHAQELELIQANANINKLSAESFMSTHNPFQEVLGEKALTPNELKKREEIAKAMERDEPTINKGKKYAIATAVAKRVAEQTESKS